MSGLLEWDYVAEKDCHSRTIVGLYNASYRSPSAFNRADQRCIQSKEQRPYRALAADTALGWFSTLEEAKAACEADFAQRLMQVPAVRELVEATRPTLTDEAWEILAEYIEAFRIDGDDDGVSASLAFLVDREKRRRKALSVFGEEM